MILSDGISRSRMVGFVLDGTAGADVGIEHHSNMSLFETRIRHQNQKFLGFGHAGIRIGYGGNAPGRKESSEIIYENCVFDSCGLSASCQLPFPPMTAMGCGGLAILNFNDYDNVVDGCHFSRNSYGIYNDKMANVYARRQLPLRVKHRGGCLPCRLGWKLRPALGLTWQRAVHRSPCA